MKGNVRFESYGNGRLSAQMWWGGVECYMREITQDPLRHFVLPVLKASGNLPPSASTEHRGGVRERRGGWHYLAPGALCERGGHTDWLTAHSAFQSVFTYLRHGPFEKGKKKKRKKLLFYVGPFYECLPVIYAITEQTENRIRILFCTRFIPLSSSISMKATDIKKSGALKETSLFCRNESAHRAEREAIVKKSWQPKCRKGKLTG